MVTLTIKFIKPKAVVYLSNRKATLETDTGPGIIGAAYNEVGCLAT